MHGRKTKNDSFSTTESVLWRNAGTSVYLLQETMLKSDKIWCTFVLGSVLDYELSERPSYMCQNDQDGLVSVQELGKCGSPSLSTSHLSHTIIITLINKITTVSHDLSSQQSYCRSSSFHSDERRTVPIGHRSLDQANRSVCL